MQTTPRQNTVVRGILLLAILAAVMFVGRSAEAAPGTTITVNTAADTDDGSCDVLVVGVSDCSLREAINAAEAKGTADFINFDIPENDAGCAADNICTITVGSTLPTFADVATTTINGSPGDITIYGGGTQPFSVALTGSLKLRRLTISGSKAAAGGAINNSGVLELFETTFSGNAAVGGSGGAVYSIGTLTVFSSTFTGNEAADEAGGAIRNNTGLLTVENSTFSGNSAAAGGAIYADSGDITHSTFYDNYAGSGGGIVDSGSVATLLLANSLLAGNSGGNCDTDGGGIIIDSGGNISSDNSCASIGATAGTIVETALADNGGPTKTHALPAGSPAINAADYVFCLAYDQRGETRPQGNGCDSGAYEVPGPILVNSTADSDDGSCNDLLPGVSDCTLREAINFANVLSGENSILFDIPAADAGCSAHNLCTITLGSTLPNITDSSGMTIIDGAGADITVDGGGAVRQLYVDPDALLTLRNMTFRDGNASIGGAIQNEGTLRIERSTFNENQSATQGAAVYSNSELTVEDSTFSNNDAVGTGGAIYARRATVRRSTFSGNHSGASSGALFGLETILVENSTFSGNSATSWGGAITSSGGSIMYSTFYGNTTGVAGGTVVVGVNDTLIMTHVIIANSFLTSGAPGQNCVASSGGSFVQGGASISDDASCTVFSFSNTDPQLDPNLADNGGPTLTHAVTPGSPVKGFGSPATCPATDQRGVARPQPLGSPGSLCDIGASEYVQPVTQNIPLAAGWNLVSSHVRPTLPEFATVLAGLDAADLVLAKNGAGAVYWPAYAVDQLGDWDVKEGYMIFMNSADTLAVDGPPVYPLLDPIALEAGWNTAAYLRDSAMPMDTALAGISGDLVLVKNGAGEVYWPAMAINDIGDMQPGQGYQMYLDSAAVLIYPDN